MKVAQVNQRIIANNIANADTPGFNPAHMDFQKALSAELDGTGNVQLRRTLPQHLEKSAHRPEFEGLAFLSKNDYNKVDLDDEIAKLSENTGRYTMFGSLLVKQFEEMKSLLTTIT
jgi:flagellar basal-body rod protein FlgB